MLCGNNDFNAVVKESFTGLSPDSGCNVVPLPPKSLVDNVAKTPAAALVDKAKLAKLESTYGGTLKLLPTSDSFVVDSKPFSVICMPTVDSLDQLTLAQAEVGRAIGQAERAAVVEFVPGALSKIRPSDAMPLAKTAG